MQLLTPEGWKWLYAKADIIAVGLLASALTIGIPILWKQFRDLVIIVGKARVGIVEDVKEHFDTKMAAHEELDDARESKNAAGFKAINHRLDESETKFKALTDTVNDISDSMFRKKPEKIPAD